jgi:hypothetical protein
MLRVYVSQTGSATLLDAIAGFGILASLLAFALSGAVILVRRPGNPIGLLLMLPGISAPAADLTSRWLASIQPPPASFTPVLWLLTWWSGWAWLLLIYPIFHLLLIFPTGRLLGRGWRLVVALEIAMITVMLAMVALGETMGPLVDNVVAWSLPNPIGVVSESDQASAFGLFWEVGLLLLTGLSAVAIGVRFRRGGRDERQQLKWPMLGALVFGMVYAGSAVEDLITGSTVVTQALLGFGLAAIPVSVAIAILRYRLYDIDRIVSRTIGWAVVTGILVLTFAGLVVGLQAVLSGVTQGETLIVAVSTLVAAALFQPVQRRVQRLVDRRFDRARYDGEQVVAAFSERLRDRVDLDNLSEEVRRVASDTVRPATTGIWLRNATNGRSGSGS